ncbi:MAG: DNRLRE domain-containing protein [Phycisphaeraceae bacterium]|nr:DNRLRE domain-containing protein [Phycisphaeraceae bacterium]
MKTICAGVVLAAAMSAYADVVVTAPLADNTLYQDAAGSVSNGAGTSFFAGRNSQGSIRRGLLLFPVGPGMGIPSGSTITGATLTLSMTQTNATSAEVTLHQVLNSWGEGTSNGSGSGAPATTGDATWLHRFYNTSTWSTPGGDFAAGALASTTITETGVYTWSSPLLTSLVQSWLDLPTGNFGLMVRGDETVNTSAMRFDSRESAVTEVRPALSITYTVPAPTAAGLGLVAAGAVSLRRRR